MDRARYAPGCEFQIGRIEMVANTGTAGIPIVEHLTRLDQLPDRGFRFHAAPPRVEGMGTFPVRAFAVVSP